MQNEPQTLCGFPIVVNPDIKPLEIKLGTFEDLVGELEFIKQDSDGWTYWKFKDDATKTIQNPSDIG